MILQVMFIEISNCIDLTEKWRFWICGGSVSGGLGGNISGDIELKKQLSISTSSSCYRFWVLQGTNKNETISKIDTSKQ